MVVNASPQIFEELPNNQQESIYFVLSKFIKFGEGELEQDKLPSL